MSRPNRYFSKGPSLSEKIWTPVFLAALAIPSPPMLLAAPGPQELTQESKVQGVPPVQSVAAETAAGEDDYHIGTSDVLEISVFEAPDLNRTVRVSAAGEITLPPLGVVKVGGLTARQLELALEASLRRTYVRNPHVAVFVKEIQSHPVFIFGMVTKPGTYQVPSGRSLIEILSLAGGVLESAGDSVIIAREVNLASGTARRGEGQSQGAEAGSGAADSEGTPSGRVARGTEPGTQIMRVSLKKLLESGNAASDLKIQARDVITVPPPMFVYVVGDVGKPGGYPFKRDESIWQMMALAGGPTSLAAKGKARIIRVDKQTGERAEIPVDLKKVLLAKSPGPALQPNDILFVPPATGRHILDRAASVGMASAPSMIVALTYRR